MYQTRIYIIKHTLKNLNILLAPVFNENLFWHVFMYFLLQTFVFLLYNTSQLYLFLIYRCYVVQTVSVSYTSLPSALWVDRYFQVRYRLLLRTDTQKKAAITDVVTEKHLIVSVISFAYWHTAIKAKVQWILFTVMRNFLHVYIYIRFKYIYMYI